jgi:DNA-binding response OmpR family regulator
MMSVMTRILVVDDEPNIVELAKMYLAREGYRLDSAANGQEAISHYGKNRYDLILLDLMLPDIDGFELCRRIRAKSGVPILMLTARKEDVDKIVGLELGADDYLTKPFNPRELVARIKAILRRYQAGEKEQEILELGRLRIDTARYEASVDSKLLGLRGKEFALLKVFLQHSGLVLSREKLLELVWGYDYYGETRTVDVHVNRLREKLAGAGVSIVTLRGVGYKMTAGEVG